MFNTVDAVWTLQLLVLVPWQIYETINKMKTTCLFFFQAQKDIDYGFYSRELMFTRLKMKGFDWSLSKSWAQRDIAYQNLFDSYQFKII